MPMPLKLAFFDFLSFFSYDQLNRSSTVGQCKLLHKKTLGQRWVNLPILFVVVSQLEYQLCETFPVSNCCPET